MVLQSPQPLSADHLPFRAVSLLGLVRVLLIPSRVALQNWLTLHTYYEKEKNSPMGLPLMLPINVDV